MEIHRSTAFQVPPVVLSGCPGTSAPLGHYQRYFVQSDTQDIATEHLIMLIGLRNSDNDLQRDFPFRRFPLPTGRVRVRVRVYG